MKSYREGWLGTLLDVYEYVLRNYQEFLQKISSQQFSRKINQNNIDPEFSSVQLITAHVLYCGYTYANYLRRSYLNLERKNVSVVVQSVGNAITALNDLFGYTAETLNALQRIAIQKLKMPFKTSWDQLFDCELMLEHAIVHFLRHQHQIEKILAYQIE